MRWVLAVVVVAACGGGEALTPDAAPPPRPVDTLPCDAPALWPDLVRSPRVPVTVHYRGAAEAATAAEVLAHVEHAWSIEVDRLGFRPPVPDGGRCGADDDLDVFVWGGIEECYVDVLGPDPRTPHDDQLAYVVVDPWGPYGGAILDTTVAHEFNHALQAADDWSDLAIAYEMTAVFVEDEVVDDDDQYLGQVADFQAHPDWSLDHDDGYETWYMYGAALYLRFVRDRYFAGDAAWIGDVWRQLRSAEATGEPDLEDALDQLLARHGTSVVASVPEFAAWRAYTGARADGAHLEEAAAMAEPTRVARVTTAGARVDVSAMALGSVYLDVRAEAGQPTRAAVSLPTADPEVEWVVQVIPGASADRDLLPVRAGPVVIDVTVPRTLIVTALPPPPDDPDDRDDTRFAATVAIDPR